MGKFRVQFKKLKKKKKKKRKKKKKKKTGTQFCLKFNANL